MLLPEGLCLDFKNENLFRTSTSSTNPDTRQRLLLLNRHGNQKESINRTSSADWPRRRKQQREGLLAPWFLRDAIQINRSSSEEPLPAHVSCARDSSRSQMRCFPSSSSSSSAASGPCYQSISLLTPDPPSRPGPRKKIPKAGRTVCSDDKSCSHSPCAMDGTPGTLEATGPPPRPLDKLMTQSFITTVVPHGTSGSIIDSRLMDTDPPVYSTRSRDIPISTPSTTLSCSTINTDFSTTREQPPSTSSPPFRSTAKQTTWPSISSPPTTPRRGGFAARKKSDESHHEAVPLVPTITPVPLTPNNNNGSQSLRRSLPPFLSKLAKSSLASIIGYRPSSAQILTSSSSVYKGASPPSLPSSLMPRKVQPGSGDVTSPSNVANTSSSPSDPTRASRLEPPSSTVCTTPDTHGNNYKKGEAERGKGGSSPPFEEAEKGKNPPRRRNVLRKRSHPRISELAQSTSTRSVSPSSRKGRKSTASYTREYEELARHRRPPHDHDRTSISQTHGVVLPNNSRLDVLKSDTRLSNDSPTLSNGTEDMGLLSNSNERIAQQQQQQQSSALEKLSESEKARQKDVKDGLTPAALIAMDFRAGSPSGSYVSQHRDSSIRDRRLSRSASMGQIQVPNPGCVDDPLRKTEMKAREEDKRRDWAASLRTGGRSLRLSITRLPSRADEETLRKSVDVSSKGGGGLLRKIMRKFSVSRDKCGDHPPPPPPIWSISTPMAFPSVVTELTTAADQSPSSSPRRKRRAETPSQTLGAPSCSPIEASTSAQMLPVQSTPVYEIPPRVAAHIVKPSVLDQACHEDEKWLEKDHWPRPNKLDLIASSSPKSPQEGEWMRSDSPDLELAALPLPPRRTPKSSGGPPSRSLSTIDSAEYVPHPSSPPIPVFSVDDAINTFQDPETSTTTTTTTATSTVLPISGAFHQSRSFSKSSSTTTTTTNGTAKLTSSRSVVIPSVSLSSPQSRPLNAPSSYTTAQTSFAHNKSSGGEEFDDLGHMMPPSEEPNGYLIFTRSSLRVTPSVVFRPGTANTFGGTTDILAASTNSARPGTSDSVQSVMSTSTERGKPYSHLAGSNLKRASSPSPSSSTETL